MKTGRSLFSLTHLSATPNNAKVLGMMVMIGKLNKIQTKFKTISRHPHSKNTQIPFLFIEITPIRTYFTLMNSLYYVVFCGFLTTYFMMIVITNQCSFLIFLRLTTSLCSIASNIANVTERDLILSRYVDLMLSGLPSFIAKLKASNSN